MELNKKTNINKALVSRDSLANPKSSTVGDSDSKKMKILK